MKDYNSSKPNLTKPMQLYEEMLFCTHTRLLEITGGDSICEQGTYQVIKSHKLINSQEQGSYQVIKGHVSPPLTFKPTIT